MDRDDLSRKLESVIARVVGPARVPPHATPDTPLGEDGYWFDSVDLLEVVLACEQEFGIVFDSSRDLRWQTVATLKSLTDLIHAKLGDGYRGDAHPR
jgi:acyl carrier protein